MKVYVVFYDEYYGSQECIGIFATKEEAINYIQKLQNNNIYKKNELVLSVWSLETQDYEEIEL